MAISPRNGSGRSENFQKNRRGWLLPKFREPIIRLVTQAIVRRAFRLIATRVCNIKIYAAMNGPQIDIYLRKKADAKFEALSGN
jgi:hypothetical protein